jgi:hypothetical protein
LLTDQFDARFAVRRIASPRGAPPAGAALSSQVTHEGQGAADCGEYREAAGAVTQALMDGPQYNSLVLGPPLGERTHVCVFYRHIRHHRCNRASPPRWDSAGSYALLTRHEARRIAANIAKLPELLACLGP